MLSRRTSEEASRRMSNKSNKSSKMSSGSVILTEQEANALTEIELEMAKEEDANVQEDTNNNTEAPNLEAAMIEVRKCTDLFFNNKFDEAMEIFAKQEHSSLIHSLGKSYLLTVYAVLTLEPDDLKRALESIKATNSLVNKRRKRTSLLTNVSNLIWRTTYEDYNDVECSSHIQLNLFENGFLARMFNDIIVAVSKRISLIWLSWTLGQFLYRMAKKSTIKPFNKVVLITGCDSGFGNLLATKMDAIGFHVFAGCLNVNSSGAIKLRRNASSRLQVVPLDVTEEKNIDNVIESLRSSMAARGTRLWALVNNAGVSNYAGIEWGRDVDKIYGMPMNVNALGSVRVTRACMSLLRESPGSRVIFVSSMAGQFALPTMVAYSMSKHAVRAFGDGLRRELSGTDVNVSIIEPSMYATGLTDAMNNFKNLKSNWTETPENVRSTLGHDEFLTHKSRVTGYLLTTRRNANEVVDKITESILTRQPEEYYRVTGFRDHLFFALATLLPYQLQDAILDSSVIAKFVKLIAIK
ncbi:17-beta-hydroxysteroid dehydrogenase type 6 [Halotydeus destructor]|nr:17-beta-hydroxysteroid dehydrogenase type 6 [Halotydeus destructor]